MSLKGIQVTCGTSQELNYSYEICQKSHPPPGVELWIRIGGVNHVH